MLEAEHWEGVCSGPSPVAAFPHRVAVSPSSGDPFIQTASRKSGLGFSPLSFLQPTWSLELLFGGKESPRGLVLSTSGVADSRRCCGFETQASPEDLEAGSSFIKHRVVCELFQNINVNHLSWLCETAPPSGWFMSKQAKLQVCSSKATKVWTATNRSSVFKNPAATAG